MRPRSWSAPTGSQRAGSSLPCTWRHSDPEVCLSGVLGDVAAREILIPALEQGRVDVVPEYLGTYLNFVGGGQDNRTADATATTLRAIASDRGIIVLDPAPAENKNVLVVTREFATERDVSKISDLVPTASELRLGGPTECPSRPLCLPGLERVYGLAFAGFSPILTGGSPAADALRAHEVDVAVMFSTDPALESSDMVVLRDDLRLQPHENVIPIVREGSTMRLGSSGLDALQQLSQRLTTSELRDLNRRVDEAGWTPREAALHWLQVEGLMS